MKIKTKINIILIGGFLIIGLIVAGVIYFYGGSKLTAQGITAISGLTEVKAAQIRTFLNGEKEVALSLASSSVFRQFLKTPKNSPDYQNQKEVSAQRVNRSMGTVGQIKNITIIGSNGEALITTNPERFKGDFSKDLCFVEGKKGVYIENIEKEEGEGGGVFYDVTAPINDDTTKELLGVILLEMKVDNLYATVGSTIAMTKTGEYFLIDSNYNLISPSRFLTTKDVLTKKIETQNTKDCFSPKSMVDVDEDDATEHILEDSAKQYIDYRGVTIVGRHHHIPETGWCLIVKEDLSEVLAPNNKLILIIGLTLLAVIIASFPISYLLSSIALKSLLVLQKNVREVAAGDLNQKIAIDTKDEIGDFSRAFNKMVESVKKIKEESDKEARDFINAYQNQRLTFELQQKAIVNILEDTEAEKTKVSALLSGIGEGVVATDINTDVIFINKSAEDMLGWKQEEVFGKSLYKFLKVYDEKDKPLSDEHRPFFVALKTGNKVFSSIVKNYFYSKKNGEKFPVSISVTPILLNDKLIGAINVFRDITHEKEVDKAKTEFVSLASHQLRTPLSAINWYTEMLLAGDAGKITKDQKQYLEEVYRSNKRMVELVNSLLNVSRIDLGTFAINPEPCDMSDVAKSILMELTPMIKTKKMKIEEFYDKSVGKINVDQKLIRIIFQNLLSNALKYTPEGGKVSVSIAKQGDNALIKVQDTGYGIPKKDQIRIFEKLFRADNIREKETDGTGLGLYIIKSILEQSGGKISFESEENKGTTFFVTIPLSGMKQKEGTKDLS